MTEHRDQTNTMAPQPTLTPSPSPTLTTAYGEGDGIYDEMKAADGLVRGPWRGFAERLDRLGAREFERRWQQGRRMIQDNGVTYNVYGDPRGMDRPWELDPVPLVISSQEWAQIEAGLIQRARLLNTVCADLYGPQTLLTEGKLPAELILGHPGFLRPCHNLAVPGGRYLSLMAVDLARSPDGRWWVLNDRTQAPSGAGYALENRLVLSRSLPGLFHDCRVTRLAEFFAGLRDALRAMSPRVGQNPRIVLLTPGPFNETFFEHAYLARYLGFTLAQGDDLTVRHNEVFLKTLGGLRRVDVILRRLDDSYCDPLELRPDSAIGVPGLVQAAWAGNVILANALGTGLLETPGLMPFYPGLCESLLGEPEKLPSVATWWCGQPKELDYVIEHLGELVVKPAYPGASAPGLGGKPIDAVFGHTLTAAQRDEVVGRLRDQPEAYAAQEGIPLSTSPVWENGRLVPRHLMLRAYVAADATGDGYRVMPGGLTRISTSAESRITSMQRGGGSKDTWVLSDTPISSFSLLPSDGTLAATALSSDSFNLPSRVADNLFWLGRYVERAEGLVRLIRAVGSRMVDDVQGSSTPELSALLSALDAVTLGKADRDRKKDDDTAAEHRVLASVFDPVTPYGLAETLGHTRRLASIARDRISVDSWRILSQLDREFQAARAAEAPAREATVQTPMLDPLTEAMDLLDKMIITLAGFTGLGTESMIRNQGWRLLDLGRRLERAVNTVGLLRALAGRPIEHEGAVLESLLEVKASAMSYRQRYLALPAALPTIDMLLLDETNPRSAAYQLVVIREHLDKLPRPGAAEGRLENDQRLALSMLSRLRLTDPEPLIDRDEHGNRHRLLEVLAQLEGQLPALSQAVARQFLSHNAVSARLGNRPAVALPPPEEPL
ncbi:MAG: circularly permuted type 2 ATP-grasp protein [Planctomycetota bacterium]